MIRFLQKKDNRLVKGIFIAIIGTACVTMIVTLVPGIFSDQASGADTYATIRGGGLLGKLGVGSTDISTAEVQRQSAITLQRQRLPEFYLPLMMQRVGQSMIQQQVVLSEAERMGLSVTNDDLRQFLHSGVFGQRIFPGGQYIGDQAYRSLIEENFQITTQKFETEVKKEIEESRLKAMLTGGITVSDEEARKSYIAQGTKIKFDYAVINSTDLEKEINPTDAELQTYFKANAARYAKAIPESRKIEYFAFTSGQQPGGSPQIGDAEIQQYYKEHQKEYSVDEQSKVRHILIKVDPGADAKTDAAAKQKAEDLLKQLKGGANFADLAKKNSDDPGSKDSGGELGFIKRGQTVPEFDQASFTLQAGQFSNVIKTRYGYHVLQVEERQSAHTRPLDEVKPTIVALLTRQKESAAEELYASQLSNEAAKQGLAKVAEAHHLQLTTTEYLQPGGIVPGLPDGSKLITKAFAAKKGATPDIASTGEGFAIFQVADIKAAHAPSFEEYKTHLESDYRQQQLPQLLARKTNELADKAKSYNDLAKAAKELGATIKTSDLVAKTGQVPDVGQLSSVAPELFDLSPGQFSKGINTGRSGVVAKLLDKQQPQADEIAKNLDQTKEALANQRREDQFEVFVTSLYDQYQKQGRILLNKKNAATIPGAAS